GDVRMIHPHIESKVEQRHKHSREQDERSDPPTGPPDEGPEDLHWSARVLVYQVVEAPAGQQGQAQLTWNQVVQYLPSKPDARNESIDPAVHRGKVAPTQEEVEKRGDPKKPSFSLTREQEPD